MDRKSLGYLASHEWVQIQGGNATIGITQFAVEQLTDLIVIELPAVGAKVTAGKSFGEIESVKAVSDLYAPVSGQVIEVNSNVTSNIQILAEDPFDKGWLVKVKVVEPLDTSGLMDLVTYEKKVADEGH